MRDVNENKSISESGTVGMSYDPRTESIEQRIFGIVQYAQYRNLPMRYLTIRLDQWLQLGRELDKEIEYDEDHPDAIFLKCGNVSVLVFGEDEYV